MQIKIQPLQHFHHLTFIMPRVTLVMLLSFNVLPTVWNFCHQYQWTWTCVCCKQSQEWSVLKTILSTSLLGCSFYHTFHYEQTKCAILQCQTNACLWKQNLAIFGHIFIWEKDRKLIVHLPLSDRELSWFVLFQSTCTSSSWLSQQNFDLDQSGTFLESHIFW